MSDQDMKDIENKIFKILFDSDKRKQENEQL